MNTKPTHVEVQFRFRSIDDACVVALNVNDVTLCMQFKVYANSASSWLFAFHAEVLA